MEEVFVSQMKFGDALRQRIRERIAALGTNVAEVERRSGFTHSFLHDFLAGKKQSMRGDSLERLANTLEADLNWLVLGRGVVQIESPAPEVRFAPLGNLPASAKGLAEQITEVQPTFAAQILIDSLNVATGEMVCRMNDAPQAQCGFIVDPAVFLPENPYARALSSRRPIAVEAKRLVLKGDRCLLAIIDAKVP
jgi:transcriptional regulator with XRE-family HTH domain